MQRKKIEPSSVELIFEATPDGLVIDRVILRPANYDLEGDLRRFLQRFRDPEVDGANLESKIRGEPR